MNPDRNHRSGCLSMDFCHFHLCVLIFISWCFRKQDDSHGAILLELQVSAFLTTWETSDKILKNEKKSTSNLIQYVKERKRKG